MKSPSPPEPPDPYKTASAQQLANIEVAQANTALANADEDSPEANVTFTQIAPITIREYKYDDNGNLTGTVDRTVDRWKRIVTLKPTQQTLFDQQTTLSSNFNVWAINQVSQLQDTMANPLRTDNLSNRRAIPSEAVLNASVPTPGALNGTIGATDLVAHLRTTRDAIDARVQYQITERETAIIAMLDQQGIHPGSRAYTRAMERFGFESNDARQQAYLVAQQEQSRIINLEAFIANFANEVQEMRLQQATSLIQFENARRLQQFQASVDLCNYVNALRQIELQEEITLRSQTVNEVSALASGGQVNVPQFSQYRGGGVGPTPVSENVYRTAAIKQRNYEIQVQRQNQMTGALLGFAGNLIGGGIGLMGGGGFGGGLGMIGR